MGPVILLDKSALQKFSREEDDIIARSYFLSIPPVLIAEIQADLQKKPQPQKLRNDAQWLASKIPATDYAISAHYSRIIRSSLYGVSVPMVGTIPVDPERVSTFRTPDGNMSEVIKECPATKALHRWTVGNFIQNDIDEAAQLRDKHKIIDLTTFNRKEVPFRIVDFEKARSIAELRKRLELLDSPDKDTQLRCLTLGLYCINATERDKTIIINRWIAREMPRLRDFAPYAHYCLRVHVAFLIGLANGLLPTKPSTVFDIEYFFYLPFCRIFVSGDNIHRKLAPLFLREDQKFVWAEDLKKTLPRTPRQAT